MQKFKENTKNRKKYLKLLKFINIIFFCKNNKIVYQFSKNIFLKIKNNQNLTYKNIVWSIKYIFLYNKIMNFHNILFEYDNYSFIGVINI